MLSQQLEILDIIFASVTLNLFVLTLASSLLRKRDVHLNETLFVSVERIKTYFNVWSSTDCKLYM